MAYKPSQECLDGAAKAAGGILGKTDIEAAFEEAVAMKQKLIAEGKLDGLNERLKEMVARKAEQTRILAAMQRRHAGLNALVRDRLDLTIEGFKAAGMKPHNALLATLEGSYEGILNGRVSVDAQKLAYESKFVVGMLADIQKERPHLLKSLNDEKLNADAMDEMVELKPGGKPGKTGNKDAQYLAKLFSTYTNLSKADLNRLGASIGDLVGWAGPQVHDDIKLIKYTKERWIPFIKGHLDLERTFPDATSIAEINDILGHIYDHIITGIPAKKSAAELGQRVNPANLAKSLGKSRVLHFRDAAAARAYNDELGHGNFIQGILAHQYRSAHMAALMDRYGPNPEVMFDSIVASEKRKISESRTLSEKQKHDQIGQLKAESGKLRHAFDIATGLINRPESVTGYQIGHTIRAVQSAAKLGGATFTAMPTDTITAAAAGMFRGGGFFSTLGQQMEGLFAGASREDLKEIGLLWGEGADSLTGNVLHAFASADGTPGKASSLLNTYFKLNFLTPWTNTARRVNATVIAAEMGMRAKTKYGALPKAYSHVLGLNGITERHWEAIRQAKTREVNGRDYITPDAILRLPDAAIEPLVRERLAVVEAAKFAGPGKPITDVKKIAQLDKRKAAIIEQGRSDLHLAALRFVADEVNYGTLEYDARARRTITQGSRPGTMTGEIIRAFMQFKGFPIAFAQRILGRAFFGHAGGTKMERLINGSGHIGSLMAGLTVAGYMSIVMKDAVKGYWPPRDPTKSLKDALKITGASIVQGGAMGIYGDFLFGTQTRYGQGLAVTAGPAIGTLTDVFNIYMKAKETGSTKLGDLINLVANNAPGANLFYVRPAIDTLFLNQLREAASPGYLRRRETKRMQEYGQQNLLPQTLQ